MLGLRTTILLLSLSLSAVARDECVPSTNGWGLCCTFRGKHGHPTACQDCSPNNGCYEPSGCIKSAVRLPDSHEIPTPDANWS
ncbi:hypothetical protein PTNB85_09858 [Pyrenophora teres f. teres]|uniref:Uncharacterized protein n=1 Tax=Pyrenophora teres f. teres TaxID=97479 RepID=A0A6S6VD25_9PLEO|nr:hypothetical protein PTNB85_09858 [Pyrenophora teres f. teres]KAE8868630.1 hypothetical protein PTNB29_02541 [Pyrenophora teres f. teres]CAA9959503.1 hypothetical protein PTMSG1_02921 [Pyrenophora teres f. maculata]CAE7020919.1 hypothetical protein PTTW11_03168 [Pyrenophora teres f. teres]